MKTLSAAEIIALIRDSPEGTTLPYWRLRRDASVAELINVLRTDLPDPDVRYVVIVVLGFRRAKRSVPLLIEALDDPDRGVRDATADALGKIRDPRAGEALMRRLTVEEVPQLRHWLVASLGGVGFRPAIPALTRLLADADPVVRGFAARSLGLLLAAEALPAIEDALSRETDGFAVRQMEQSLRWFDSPEGVPKGARWLGVLRRRAGRRWTLAGAGVLPDRRSAVARGVAHRYVRPIPGSILH
jgi:HEAT repeat protein